ncbi:Serpentine Receptor, class Z [Caenorhabditis elegans]|uniref:Serpentine Receptor, class Z n=1 Tax=Caenorhabditis elegans TaxID=6239 RepID=Q9XV83_CAEEL|nr:Serpentine Receptor, class Z [Caenorhabditis elegans]CAB04142.1 Serpentine Receptor, class Z [Caenorhabditis elegans]|eukprot:NP_507419.1 Serpentine Receptor, class Z [Caenorhabditis elegans]
MLNYNISELLKNDERFKGIDFRWGPIFLYFFFAFIIIYTILLPFYVFTNKLNHKRDNEMFIYPTAHFCQMVKVSYLVFVSACFNFILAVSVNSLQTNRVLIALLFFALFNVLYIITQAFHVLIFVLAVERFFIYFFPSSEKIFKSLSIKIKHLYFVIIAKDFSCFVFTVWKRNAAFQTVFQNLTWVDFFFLMTWCINDIIVFISALLYIPIFISVRKLVNLQSVQRSKPHNYIFLQTMVVFTLKSIHILIYIMTSHGGNFSPILFTNWIIVTDFITTPLIVQMSYLSCNKRNMSVLFSSHSIRYFFNVLFHLKTGAVVFPRQTSQNNYSTL